MSQKSMIQSFLFWFHSMLLPKCWFSMMNFLSDTLKLISLPEKLFSISKPVLSFTSLNCLWHATCVKIVFIALHIGTTQNSSKLVWLAAGFPRPPRPYGYYSGLWRMEHWHLLLPVHLPLRSTYHLKNLSEEISKDKKDLEAKVLFLHNW